MRRATLGLALLLAACSTSSRRPPPATVAAAGGSSATSAGRPGWLPAYDARQRALLRRPPASRVDARAEAIYPNIERFSYARPVQFDANRAKRAAADVEHRLHESPLLYVLERTEPVVANVVAQYGPPAPAEPDDWVIAEPADERGRFALSWAVPNAAAKSAVDEANAHLAQGRLDAASDAFVRALKESPGVPALWVYLARTRAAARDDAGAREAIDRALAVAPRFPAAHRELAMLLARSGDRAGAAGAIARALAAHPTSEEAWKVARSVARVLPRPEPPAIFLDVGESGAIVVGSPEEPARRTYAMCRAAVRYEHDLRARVLGLPVSRGYHLSMGEELFCTEAMLGRYLYRDALPPPPRASRLSAGGAPEGAAVAAGAPDPQLDQLHSIAERGHLAAYVLFDVIGKHRPEWLRVAPPELYESVVRYVSAVVLQPL